MRYTSWSESRHRTPPHDRIQPDAHALIKKYHATLTDITGQGAHNEGAVQRAFETLLIDTGKKRGLTLLAEQTIGRKNGRIRVDGVLNDANRYPFGYWEAKDSKDDLDSEIVKKIAKDYPLQNIIFEDTPTVFDMPEFTRRNVIAIEVEKVIIALTSRHFNKADFLGRLDFFYKAIENAGHEVYLDIYNGEITRAHDLI